MYLTTSHTLVTTALPACRTPVQAAVPTPSLCRAVPPPPTPRHPRRRTRPTALIISNISQCIDFARPWRAAPECRRQIGARDAYRSQPKEHTDLPVLAASSLSRRRPRRPRCTAAAKRRSGARADWAGSSWRSARMRFKRTTPCKVRIVADRGPPANRRSAGRLAGWLGAD